MSLSFQGSARRSRTFPRGAPLTVTLSLLIIALRFFSGAGRRSAFRGWLQFDPSTPRFRKPDCNRLLRRSSSMLSFSDMVHFLTHKLPSLCARRLAFPCILLCAIQCLFFRHKLLLI